MPHNNLILFWQVATVSSFYGHFYIPTAALPLLWKW